MKNFLQNLHTHTTYCDGSLSAEEMIKAAIERGGSSIGFSEHSYVSFDEEYSMMPCDTPLYMAEINKLKQKYEGQVEVYLGIEYDYFTETDNMPGALDYIIGAVHHIEKDGEFITIDATYERIQNIRDNYFGGDMFALTQAYYATIASVTEKTKVDIIGHFDIIAKQNEQGRLFDESDPRYITAATNAMERILEKCKIFEVSSGSMFRTGRSVPYPSEMLLALLKKHGGEVLLSSDSHVADSLYYKFDEMLELIKACGFTHIKRLTKDGFVDEKL
ncbi:MAG: histidinol-phosphatase [Oscillospiraceae bacterium]|nr:histidinol-phosphatase [Oscillospiraceae bacterium]